MRLLCRLSFSVTLDDYYRAADDESDTMAAAIAKSIERGDHGFSDYWWRMTEGTCNMMPITWLAQARYLMADTVKLCYLFRIFWTEGLWHEPQSGARRLRFLLFVHWPMVLWLTEMFLDSLGVRYATIRAQMGENARREAAERFTKPISDCEVLLTSYQCGAHGLNLHSECSRVVLLKPPLNMNTLFQAVGQVHRLGQREAQKAWVLFQEHSISRWIECNNVVKALPQFAAQLHDLLKPLVLAAQTRPANTGDSVHVQTQKAIGRMIKLEEAIKIAKACEDDSPELRDDFTEGIKSKDELFADAVNNQTKMFEQLADQIVKLNLSGPRQ
ncbi:C-terminal helicase domain-containing protein [Aspergillus thermomutatus]|uniref:Helicase C-terminal domain-containing protein n=1 Tax=Aspergillus thermomutatus TaxID=41047 RepID=A0A397G4W1_ASPTH|nr:uncharacterized protein CDV56_104095 [Aspergillus thermomutatus]RHZ46015.1 hypothetical protein CDV56_104095 [Aspergillus thermomutatus]